MYAFLLIALLIITFCVVTFFFLRIMSADKYVVPNEVEQFETTEATMDTVVSAFKSAIGRLPTKSEAESLVAKFDNGSLNMNNLPAHIKQNFASNETVQEEAVRLFQKLDSALKADASGSTSTTRKAIANSYASLLCQSVRGQTLKQFYVLMEDKYREKMMLIMDCVQENDKQLGSCSVENINAVDAGLFSDTTQFCAAVDSTFCGSRASNGSLMDRERFDNIIASSQQQCLSRIEKCMKPTPPPQQSPSTTSCILSDRPDISRGGVPSQTDIKKIEEQCLLNFQKKQSALADLTHSRNVEELGMMCARAQTDQFHILPGQEWSVPQKRAPVCTTTAPGTVANSLEQTALIGTLLEHARDTEVGSIMPKFTYEEH